MDELMKKEHSLNDPQLEDAYQSILSYAIEAQRQVYMAVNSAVMTVYWKIGNNMTPVRIVRYDREWRTAPGHVQSVEYGATVRA